MNHIYRTIVMMLFASTSFSTSIVYSTHCPLGCPANPEGNIQYFGHIYGMSLNPETKFADWVAYEVDITNFGVTPGRDWKQNPVYSPDMVLEESDYVGANASILKADKGHQAPLASFANNKYWYEANYLSNITPQHKNLNQGPWKELEAAVRGAVDFRNSLWVITGPIYSNIVTQLPNADEPHSLPSGYFKVVYDLKGGAVAFIMSQSIKRNDEYCGFIIPIKSLPIDSGIFKQSESIKSRLRC